MMESHPFLNPKLSGKRFEDHSIPVELLEDFKIYQELLLKVAKHVYYETHDKHKVPKGFGEGISLKLSNISEGSSIANLILVASSFLIGELDTYPIFEEARQRIILTINDADQNGELKERFPAKYLEYFNKIGKRLRDDESITFQSPNLQSTATLTKLNRKKLVLAVPGATSVSAETTVRGKISAFDKAEKKCTIITNDKLKIALNIDSESSQTLLEAFNGFENNRKVEIKGIGFFNEQDKLECIDVEAVTLLDPLDVPDRLDEFLGFQKGWFDGEGEEFNRNDIAWLSDSFREYFNTETYLPYTFPTPQGDVQFEWKNGPHDLTAYVNLKTKTAQLYYNNIHDDALDWDRGIDLGSEDGWGQLQKEITRYFNILT